MSGRTERELAKRLYERDGFQVIRSPSSGSVPRPQPDVLAAKDGRIYAIEGKSCTSHSTANRIYVTQREINELDDFADAFAASPMVSARFNGDRTIYVVPFVALNETRDNGQGELSKTTFVLSHDDARDAVDRLPSAFSVAPLS